MIVAALPACCQYNEIAVRALEEVARAAREAGLEGRIESYLSKMDGKRHEYTVCATSPSSTPKPLVIQVDGAPSKPGPGDIRKAEEYAWYVKKNGQECVVLHPTGRGPGSIYQNYGEVDALEAIEDAATKFPIDRDRISVTGSSVGGAATWYLISHYPDLFSAGAPMAGYCDYRLWEKPGGYTFPMQEWEEPSWQARSAAFLIENFEHTPVWITHGEWDRSVAGGVPVAQSRRMAALLGEKGFAVKYTEIPGIGHYSPPARIEPPVVWLLQQKKVRHPAHVALATYWLRHNRSYWVSIDQFERYGRRAWIDANQTGADILVKTDNVRAFHLGPMAAGKSGTVRIGEQVWEGLDFRKPWFFQRPANGGWRLGAADLSREKHHGSSGPISDIFFDNLILVPGSEGTAEENFYNALAAENTLRMFRQTNGGLHRGGIPGSNTVDLETIKDVELGEDQIRKNNLLLFGSNNTNAILKRYRNQLPIGFEQGAIRLGDRTYSGARVTVFSVFRHPDNPNRYIAVHGGVTPDAITWGSHLNVQLLPDYVVYDGGKMLDWGFWDNEWKHPARPAK
jgi:predicted esterase